MVPPDDEAIEHTDGASIMNQNFPQRSASAERRHEASRDHRSRSSRASEPGPGVRTREQMTMRATETAKISVETALISGVMPRRRRPQISSGKVLSRPIRKKLTAISSMESVKISSAAPKIESLRLGSVIRQNVCQ